MAVGAAWLISSAVCACAPVMGHAGRGGGGGRRGHSKVGQRRGTGCSGWGVGRGRTVCAQRRARPRHCPPSQRQCLTARLLRRHVRKCPWAALLRFPPVPLPPRTVPAELPAQPPTRSQQHPPLPATRTTQAGSCCWPGQDPDPAHGGMPTALHVCWLAKGAPSFAPLPPPPPPPSPLPHPLTPAIRPPQPRSLLPRAGLAVVAPAGRPAGRRGGQAVHE